MRMSSLHLPAILFTILFLTLSNVVLPQNVGIGTQNPQAKLHIYDGSIRVDHIAPYLNLNDTTPGNFAGIKFQRQGNTLGNIHFRTSSDFLRINADDGSGLRNDLVIKSSGKLGIGTDNPDQKLEVNGNIKLGNNIMVEGGNGYNVYRNLASYFVAASTAAGAFVIKTNQPRFAMWAATIKGYVYGEKGLFEITVGGYGNEDQIAYIQQGDYRLDVRIGLDADSLVIILGPETGVYNFPMLTVTEFRQAYNTNEEAYADGWTITQETDLTAYLPLYSPTDETEFIWTKSGDDIYYTDGKAGIGTTSPDEKLHVAGNIRLDADNPFVVVNDTSTGNNAGMVFRHQGNSQAYIYYKKSEDNLLLSNSASGARNDLVINDDGKVGIGTDSPGQQLEVTGNIKLGDNIMVEGNEELKVFRNLVSYGQQGNANGAFVIHTNIPGSVGCMWTITVKGYEYNLSGGAVFEMTAGAFNQSGHSAYIYEGDFKLDVRTATDGGNLVLILGNETSTYGWPYITVSECRLGLCNTDESRAEGWTITQEADLSGYSMTAMNNVTDEQWSENGNDIYFDNGNVGIGTTAPASKLEVNGNIETNGTTPYVSVDAPAGSTSMGFRLKSLGNGMANIFYDLGNSYLKINADGGSGTRNDLVIENDGDIGIGTDSPAYRLDVSGGSIRSGGNLITATNGVLNAGGGLDPDMNVISDISNPTTFFADGDEDLFIQDDLELGTTGQGYKPGGGPWASVSDERLKKNIKPYIDGLNQLMQIEPVSYQYNGSFSAAMDNGKSYVGVLAQDIQKVAPYTVEELQLGRKISENKDGTETIIEQGSPYLAFDGSALTYMLINSVKEQQQIIESQQSQIDEMAEQLDLLMQKIEALGE